MAPSAPSLDLRELAKRIASAVILGPVVLAAIHFGTPWLEILMLAVIGIGSVEWIRMAGTAPESATGVAIIVLTLLTVPADIVIGPIETIVVAATLSVVGGLVFAGAGRSRVAPWAIFYLGVPAATILWLRARPDDGEWLVFWVFVVVWATDTGAYVAGRLIGGPKLAPVISPKKTWAGAAGGVVAAAVLGGVAASVLGGESVLFAAIVAVPTSIACQAGDLFESWLKRRFGVKDSGTLIPGHGGILDRIDGLIFAAPFLAVFHWLVGERMGWW